MGRQHKGKHNNNNIINTIHLKLKFKVKTKIVHISVKYYSLLIGLL